MRAMQQLESGFAATLTRTGLVRVSGEDAVAFIHGQLSNDIANLKDNEARFAGYCTPEGRLLASVLAWKSENDVWLLLPRDILPELVKRLQIYILRSQVKIMDASDEFAVTGLGGKKAAEVIAGLLQQMSSDVYGKADSASGTFIRIRDAFGAARYLWIAPAEMARAIQPSLASVLAPANDEDWELGDIQAGMPQIYTATQNRFVPQMVNMELVGGMSFTKGCYPGQEIVARTQYRGTLKRRMISAHADMPGNGTALESGIVPGLDIFNTAVPNEPCGIVVRAARHDEKRIDCLVVVPRDMSASKFLRVGALDGPKIYPDALPYALPDET